MVTSFLHLEKLSDEGERELMAEDTGFCTEKT
jgi:hypothetical protein